MTAPRIALSRLPRGVSRSGPCIPGAPETERPRPGAVRPRLEESLRAFCNFLLHESGIVSKVDASELSTFILLRVKARPHGPQPIGAIRPLVFGAFLAAAIAGGFACRKDTRSDAPAAAPQKTVHVEAIAVDEQLVPKTLAITGSLEYDQR